MKAIQLFALLAILVCSVFAQQDCYWNLYNCQHHCSGTCVKYTPPSTVYCQDCQDGNCFEDASDCDDEYGDCSSCYTNGNMVCCSN
mmetsp:Transcript_18727/g.16246  ORF Transcript_18727/g.16246 Transcript_18727/m.16246 type:complete len:86 (+) Transcript_18727:84-341(+)